MLPFVRLGVAYDAIDAIMVAFIIAAVIAFIAFVSDLIVDFALNTRHSWIHYLLCLIQARH